ncbi:MAG TPA: flagellar biosynthetic protein FliP, partial [Pseudobdellovibrionaceae bacterium]
MKKILLLVGLVFFGMLGQQVAFAQQVTLPTVNLGFKTTENPNEVVNAIKLVLIMTVLTLAPAILIMMTGFTR